MIQEVENQSLLQLREYFERLGDRLHTGPLRWYFEIRLFEIGASDISLAELIKFAYPEALPEKAQITAVVFSDFQKTLDYWFTTNRTGQSPVQWLIRGDKFFAYLLNECCHYTDAAIYEYSTQEGLDPLGAGILGAFAFIFVNSNQGRLLILSGGDCD